MFKISCEKGCQTPDMKISELIEVIKNYHKGDVEGVIIDDETTRDQILSCL